MNFLNPNQAPVVNVNTSAHATLIRQIGTHIPILV